VVYSPLQMPYDLTRRRFVATSGLALAGCGGARDGRPNILWLIAEDICADLGCYGNPLVHTPNLDRLAAEGIRFNHAYVTGPICSPSRSAISTGMYQTSLAAHNHRSHRDDDYRLPGGVRIFTHYFHQAGYHTSLVTTAAPGVRGSPKTDFNFNVERPFGGSDWSQRPSGQPFYAQVNFSETHRPFRRFPERPIDPAAVTLPASFPDHPVVRQDWAMYLETMQHLDVKVGRVLQRLRDEKLLEETIVFFFGDNGRPLPRGKGFLYEGGIHIPLIVRFPEKYRPEDAAPGSVRDDLVSTIDITATSLELAGIGPPVHMHGRLVFGRDAKPRDCIVAAVDRCDESVDRVRCVRAQRFKYLRNFYPERPYCQPNVYRDTEYPSLRVMRELHGLGKLTPQQAHFTAPHRPEEELYDLEADPHELHNLAGSPDHQQTLSEMRAILDRWIKETGDKGETPEPKLPRSYDYRLVKVDEWCTRDCLLSKANGVMRVEVFGKQHKVMRGIVAEGGDMELRFRARSRNAGPKAFSWGTVVDFSNPANSAPIDFVADGNWREYSVPFRAEGHLALLAFNFDGAEGLVEFDRIRLYRKTGPRPQLVQDWNFA